MPFLVLIQNYKQKSTILWTYLKNMYDTIIIGSGPAGMAAGVYSSRREMKTLIIGKEVGGQMVMAHEIENYPGVKRINAFDLIQTFKEQVLSFGVEMKDLEVKK